MSSRRILHVADAIIRREHEVVLVWQAAPGEEPFWALPGGVIKDGELVPEGLRREVLEETGLTIRDLRIAYIRQVDNRQADGLVTVWVFEARMWSGELDPRDPDGLVSEARFVPVAEAADLLDRTVWLRAGAAYLRGEIKPGSILFQRWHDERRITPAGP